MRHLRGPITVITCHGPGCDVELVKRAVNHTFCSNKCAQAAYAARKRAARKAAPVASATEPCPECTEDTFCSSAHRQRAAHAAVTVELAEIRARKELCSRCGIDLRWIQSGKSLCWTGSCPGRSVAISDVDLNRWAGELAKLGACFGIAPEDGVGAGDGNHRHNARPRAA